MDSYSIAPSTAGEALGGRAVAIESVGTWEPGFRRSVSPLGEVVDPERALAASSRLSVRKAHNDGRTTSN